MVATIRNTVWLILLARDTYLTFNIEVSLFGVGYISDYSGAHRAYVHRTTGAILTVAFAPGKDERARTAAHRSVLWTSNEEPRT